MLEGLMQHDYPLTLQLLLDRMRRLYANDGTVVSVRGEDKSSMGYGEIVERVEKLAKALDELGVQPGDRVATFAWNIREHLEIYLAVPCMGAVLHTLNIRLFPEQLAYIVNHAEDKVILVEASLVPVLRSSPRPRDRGALRRRRRRRHRQRSPAHRYEELLGGQDPGYDFPELDERRPPACATRAAPPATPRACSTRTAPTSCTPSGRPWPTRRRRSDDRVLPIVPMFHANAWGMPYVGHHRRRLVMPGALPPARAAGRAHRGRAGHRGRRVPTIWTDLLRYADENARSTSPASGW